ASVLASVVVERYAAWDEIDFPPAAVTRRAGVDRLTLVLDRLRDELHPRLQRYVEREPRSRRFAAGVARANPQSRRARGPTYSSTPGIQPQTSAAARRRRSESPAG